MFFLPTIGSHKIFELSRPFKENIIELETEISKDLYPSMDGSLLIFTA